MMVGQTSGGALMNVLGMLLQLIPFAIGVFFIWVALRVVNELSGIQERLTEIRDRLPRAWVAD
jgi:hypothetical protein